MRIILKTPLKCIKKEGLLDFNIEKRNGSPVIVAGTFSQTIKLSELNLILSSNINNVKSVSQVDVIDPVNDKEDIIAEEEESAPVVKKAGRPKTAHRK